ncbi:GntR family transcriptional regulator [Pseudomonas aeruginosa]|uniref:GntR family transcriptional regulator n=1 Tax=Pseudomonas aeruginosa TaxID=287 RepID=UPI003896CFAA
MLISDSSDLIRTLAKRVSDQELSVGDHLPREQAFSEAYWVSRSTLRAGLDIVQNQEGYYSIATGQSVSIELVEVRGSRKIA